MRYNQIILIELKYMKCNLTLTYFEQRQKSIVDAFIQPHSESFYCYSSSHLG